MFEQNNACAVTTTRKKILLNVCRIDARTRYPPTFGNGPVSLLDVGDGDGDDECVGVGDDFAVFDGDGDGDDFAVVVAAGFGATSAGVGVDSTRVMDVVV